MRVQNGGACSACFNFQENVRHVDLGAAYDGPVLENGMPIDDLILCESCVQTSVRALELSESGGQVEDALSRVEFAEGVAEKWKAYARELERTLNLRPENLPEVPKTGRKKRA